MLPGKSDSVRKMSAVTPISAEILAEYAEMGELIGKALRGEIKTKSPPLHRCLACWLIGKLPGHDRCAHGRITCDYCLADY